MASATIDRAYKALVLDKTPNQNNKAHGFLNGHKLAALVLLGSSCLLATVAAVVATIFASYVLAAACATAGILLLLSTLIVSRIDAKKTFLELVDNLSERIKNLVAQNHLKALQAKAPVLQPPLQQDHERVQLELKNQLAKKEKEVEVLTQKLKESEEAKNFKEIEEDKVEAAPVLEVPQPVLIVKNEPLEVKDVEPLKASNEVEINLLKKKLEDIQTKEAQLTLNLRRKEQELKDTDRTVKRLIAKTQELTQYNLDWQAYYEHMQKEQPAYPLEQANQEGLEPPQDLQQLQQENALLKNDLNEKRREIDKMINERKFSAMAISAYISKTLDRVEREMMALKKVGKKNAKNLVITPLQQKLKNDPQTFLNELGLPYMAPK